MRARRTFTNISEKESLQEGEALNLQTTFGVKNSKGRVVYEGHSETIPLRLDGVDPEADYGDEDFDYCEEDDSNPDCYDYCEEDDSDPECWDSCEEDDSDPECWDDNDTTNINNDL